MSLSYIKDSRNFWTVVVFNKSYQFDQTHEKYDQFVEAIKLGDSDVFVKAFDTTAKLNTWGEGHFVVKDGVLMYKDNEVHKVVADRIIEMVKEGFDHQPMLRFVERLYMNPSFRAITELYNFLQHKFLPIDPDGYFLAYKAVTKDFKDKYTSSVDNSIGQKPEMARYKVNDDCDQGCSNGYHVGAHAYASGFCSGDDVMIICKVDPADVVSIPKDSNQKKLRCCKYEVVGLYEGEMCPAVVDKYSDTKAPTRSYDDDDDDDDEQDSYDEEYDEEYDEDDEDEDEEDEEDEDEEEDEKMPF